MAATAADLVGREQELAAAVDFLEAHAPARALVIEGEAGIGKTTLWQAALDAAARSGLRTLIARPAESEAKLAFSSLADLMTAALDDELLSQLAPPQRRALEVALLIDDGGGAPADRRAVAAGLLSALRILAAQSPLVVAIDDVQWLDRASAAALEFACRRLEDEPVALVLARRVDDATGESSLDRSLPAERLQRLPIGPLDFVALNGVLHERLGTILSRPVLRRIYELSGGNPFFALELAREPERLEPGRELPPTLDVLVRGRVSAQPEEARTALVAAAALSQPTVEIVDAAVRVRDALAPAEAAHIVAIAHGNVRFEHPLLASAAYAAVDPARRREVHRRLGALVGDPEERARHLAAAATGPDEAVAKALDEGAVRARARGAPAVAAELSEQAAELTPPDDEGAKRRRLADAGYFQFESGDSRRALALLDDVAAQLAPGPERASVLIRLARVRSYSANLEASTVLFLQAAEEAAEERALKARALEGASAQLFRQRRRLDEAVDHAKHAARLARELGNDELLALALGSQLLAEATLGRDDAAATLDEAVKYQSAVEHERILAQPEWTAAIARMWWEEPGRVRPAYEKLIDRGRASGDEGSLAYIYVMLAQADCLLGDFERAWRNSEAAREIAEQAGQITLVAYGLAVRALVDAHRGLEQETREAVARALEFGRETGFTPVWQFAGAAAGLLELSLGDSSAAAAQLAPLVEFAQAEKICEPGLTRYVIDHVEALVELGHLDDARELLAWYEGDAARLGRRGALASCRRCLGLLAAAQGQLDEAAVALERALGEHDAVPFPFDRARTLLALGATLRRAKRKADARDRLEQAAAAFDELGAATFAARARAELARIGGRRRSDGDLTETERQIAELVAEGKSNKEVAAALFVTVKTVEANLSKVYAKLGIRSRTELARRLAEGEAAVKP